MKNENFGYGCNLKAGCIVSLGLKRYFFVLCFMILPVFFLTSLIGAEISPEQRDPNNTEISEPNNGGIFMNPNINVRQQLLNSQVNIAGGEGRKTRKNELRRIIEQIRSITFDENEQLVEPEPVVVPKVEPIAEPNEVVSDTSIRKEPEKKEILTNLSYEPVTDQTLQTLRELSKKPEELGDPFELGETLFLSGNLKEAVVFYQEALKRINSNNGISTWDEGWILFQIGNCLRVDDPLAAIKVYEQLITEFDNSLWKDLAEARSKLLNLYETEEIQELIDEYKP